MKKWLYPAAILAAIGILARLPHPAKDIAKLKPIRAVYLYMDEESLQIETDTGDSGSGPTLTEATEDMRSNADGEIFLDTAEFLVLSTDVPIAEDFFALLRPDCRVVFSDRKPDLEKTPDYLSIHKPKTTLNQLRASIIQRSEHGTQYEKKGASHASKTAHPLAPGGDGGAAGTFHRRRLAECHPCGPGGSSAEPPGKNLGGNAETRCRHPDPLARHRGGTSAGIQRRILALGQ